MTSMSIEISASVGMEIVSVGGAAFPPINPSSCAARSRAVAAARFSLAVSAGGPVDCCVGRLPGWATHDLRKSFISGVSLTRRSASLTGSTSAMSSAIRIVVPAFCDKVLSKTM